MSLLLKKIYHRSHNKVMKAASMLIPFPVPELLKGDDSLSLLVNHKKMKKLKNILIVTDKGLMDLNLLDELFSLLKSKGINYVVYDKVQANPTIENVENGRLLYKEKKCDAIIAFGGGSPIDCAKVIGARVNNSYRSVKKMKGLFKVWLPIPPLFCIPTTAGTGSETTIVAVITDSRTHEKFAINDLKLVPKVAVLNSKLMKGLPPHITSTTGMDALTHAIEAYIGLNGTKLTDEKAKKAVKLIMANLENVYKDGSDLEARADMALASFDAGIAFTRAYIGYVHAIAHNMGGLYGVPHGLANAIILPHVLDFSFKNSIDKLADLAKAASIGDKNDNNEVLARKFIDKIKKMNKNMNIPSSIKELKEKDIPLIIKRVFKEAHPSYPVPRIMSYSDCESLVEQLLVNKA